MRMVFLVLGDIHSRWSLELYICTYVQYTQVIYEQRQVCTLVHTVETRYNKSQGTLEIVDYVYQKFTITSYTFIVEH